MSDPATSAFVCDRCARCCHTHTVPITVTDLRRLVQRLGNVSALASVDWLAPDDIDLEGEPECFFELREGRRVLVLRRRASSPFDVTGQPCALLGIAGCSVHQARPMACRTYPFDRAPVAAHSVRRLGLVPGAMCPDETNLQATLGADPRDDATAQSYLSDREQRDAELRAHAEVVQRCNLRAKLRLRMGRLPHSGPQVLQRLLAEDG